MAKAKKGEQTWKQAIIDVLSNSGRSLHYSEITKRILENGLKSSVGATPAQTVNAQLSVAIRNGDPTFVRTDPGVFGLTVYPKLAGQTEPFGDGDEDSEEEYGALTSLGMFWSRDRVKWQTRGRLLGRQDPKAADVDFANQIGIYLLHDRDRVIYVGRATESIYARLYAHTSDRLQSRWDRFSWFGLRPISENGELQKVNVSWKENTVIETLEAALIEALEPVQNRKRGDSFAAIEFLQSEDPQIEKEKQKRLLAELISKSGLD